jgi:transglutaminase-like putative cysteine protease
MEGHHAARGYFAGIPTGTDGVRETLRIMVRIARKFLKPSVGNAEQTAALLTVRLCAGQVTLGCAEKDYTAEASALQCFVRDHIRYTRDLRTAETIQFPNRTLEFGYGDCDDKALLFCCLAECVGFETRFCAIGTDDSGFSHVSGQLLIPGCGWTNAETIPIDDSGTKVDLGWFPPDCTCLMLAHI